MSMSSWEAFSSNDINAIAGKLSESATKVVSNATPRPARESANWLPPSSEAERPLSSGIKLATASAMPAMPGLCSRYGLMCQV